MTKSQLCGKRIGLPSVIFHVHNQFEKPSFGTVFKTPVPSFVYAVLLKPLLPVPEFGQNGMTQLL